MSTKDFAELMVDNLIAAAERYAVSNPMDDFLTLKREALEQHRQDVIQALRVPSPHSEDLRDGFAKAALHGLLASAPDSVCESKTPDGIEAERREYAALEAKSAYRYADAMMKAREVKA